MTTTIGEIDKKLNDLHRTDAAKKYLKESLFWSSIIIITLLSTIGFAWFDCFLLVIFGDNSPWNPALFVTMFIIHALHIPIFIIGCEGVSNTLKRWSKEG